MAGLFRSLLSIPFTIRRLETKMNDLLMLEAKQCIGKFKYDGVPANITEFEFKVFSQWGDDGIIQYLVNKLDITEKKFIEFGIENYRESNTRFLLMNNNWDGLVFDGSNKNITTVRSDDIFWRYNLKAECAFITAENINQLFEKNNFTGRVGLLHIDIDGNEYWIWKAIENVDADIVIMEYNMYFGSERAITIPYNPQFSVVNAHYSRIYFGASLAALNQLAEEKGYFFIGCNSAGNNAYFLNNRHKGKLNQLSVKDGFVMSKSRQTRNKTGELDFSDPAQAADIIKGLPVINTITGATEIF